MEAGDDVCEGNVAEEIDDGGDDGMEEGENTSTLAAVGGSGVGVLEEKVFDPGGDGFDARPCFLETDFHESWESFDSPPSLDGELLPLFGEIFSSMVDCFGCRFDCSSEGDEEFFDPFCHSNDCILYNSRPFFDRRNSFVHTDNPSFGFFEDLPRCSNEQEFGNFVECNFEENVNPMNSDTNNSPSMIIII